MKKLLIPVVILLMAVSCKKDENCHCGEILKTNRQLQIIDVRNNCTENGKQFQIRTQNEMDRLYEGGTFCDPNQATW